MIQCINPDKVYLVTGGTNHGVEREAHIIANRLNTQQNKGLVVLGTLTEEAANIEFNSVEPNTITHAITAEVAGRPAKRWFDLGDATLGRIQEENGMLLAIGGGAIVSDIIQRAHNLGLHISTMSNVVGASGTKSTELAGNGYDFATVKELIINIILAIGPDAIRPDIVNEDQLDSIIHSSFVAYLPEGQKCEPITEHEHTIPVEVKTPEAKEQPIDDPLNNNVSDPL